MEMKEVSIPTPDGHARAFTFHPQGNGPWPAVIFYMDAPAIRPALFTMCERLAGHSYFVLLPDMFWRAGPTVRSTSPKCSRTRPSGAPSSAP